MSENNNVKLSAPENPEYKQTPSGARYVEVSEGVNVVENVITRDGSRFKGIIYHTPEFLSLSAALQSMDEDQLLLAVNSYVARAVYARVNNKLKSGMPETEAEQNAYIERILLQPERFTIQDALDFKLGETEMTPSAINRLIGKTLKKATEFASKGQLAEAGEQYKLISELMAKFQAAAQRVQQGIEVDSGVEE